MTPQSDSLPRTSLEHIPIPWTRCGPPGYRRAERRASARRQHREYEQTSALAGAWWPLTSTVNGNAIAPAKESSVVTFQPGESKIVPFWVLAQVLTNAQPRVSPETMDAWKFTAAGISAGSVRDVIKTSDPHAGRCEAEDVLMLYARLPFSVEAENGTENMVACKRAR
jgi:hypothetical protein